VATQLAADGPARRRRMTRRALAEYAPLAAGLATGAERPPRPTGQAACHPPAG
jgi:hypothetical protein